MKVLMVNKADIIGGAARAAYRLHRALISQGVDSKMLVSSKKSDDDSVLADDSKKSKIFAAFVSKLDSMPVRFYKNKSRTLFNSAWISINKLGKIVKEINPDIVHLHWICGGMLRIGEIKKINVPIVWSLHDMWAFTGGCHYDEWCNKYKNNCGKCKVLNSKFDYDLSRSVWNRKNRVFSKTENITIVGLSNWLAECAKNSSLLKKKTVVNLPNPIDTNKYKPIDKSVARELLNLPQNKKIILFGAMSATSDKRKGYSQLIDAVNKIEEENIELVVFGNSGSKIKEDFKYKINFVGKLKDDISLQILYSAADVMIVPSLQENLSNVILESLSCAIPVVAFDIGGNSDMIEHKNNGYLAKPFDTYDLAKGIEWILNSENYSFLCENARNKAINEFDSKIVANRYIDLYKKIIDKTFS